MIIRNMGCSIEAMTGRGWMPRAIWISLFFHAVCVGLVVLAGRSSIRVFDSFLVDLRLADPPLSFFAPVSLLKGKTAAENQKKQLPAPAIKDEMKESEVVSNQPIRLPSDSQAGMESERLPFRGGQIPSSPSAGAGSYSAFRGGGAAAVPTVQGQECYVKEHFAYIRDLIQKQVQYPAFARRTGWEGRVVVSFLVTHDGTAKEVTIVEGTDLQILRQSAVEAVMRVSPFPRPPAEAHIIIPVTFKLK